MPTHHKYDYLIIRVPPGRRNISVKSNGGGHRKVTSISEEDKCPAGKARFQSSQCLLVVVSSVSNRRIPRTSSLNVITLYLPKLLMSALNLFSYIFLSANIDFSQMDVRYGNPFVSTDAKMYRRSVCWVQIPVYVCLKVKKILETSVIISTWMRHLTCCLYCYLVSIHLLYGKHMYVCVCLYNWINISIHSPNHMHTCNCVQISLFRHHAFYT